MCREGMNVARLNFSHGTHEGHRETVKRIKKVREELSLPIAIMLDTKGPEYRIGTFKDKKINLSDGDEFIFTTLDVVGDEKRVSVSYENLVKELSVGDRILVNNGLVIFEVTELSENEAKCKVIAGGELSDRKSMHFPNKVLKGDYLSEADNSTYTTSIIAKEKCDHTETEVVGKKEATETEEGYTGDTVCKNCGEVLAKGETIPVKEPATVEPAPTGDLLLAVSALALASVAGVVAIARKRKIDE